MKNARVSYLLAAGLLIAAGLAGYLILEGSRTSPEEVAAVAETHPDADPPVRSAPGSPGELRRRSPGEVDPDSLHEQAISQLRRGADQPVSLDRQQLEELIEQVRHGSDVTTRRKALGKLASVTDSNEVLVATIEALGDPEPEVRVLAAWMLGEFGDRRAILDLKKAAQDDRVESVRIAATQALRRLGEGGS